MQIRLRKLQSSDLDSYFQIVGDTETMAYITGEAYSLPEAEQEIQRLIDRFGKHPVFGIWVAESVEDKQFIGVGGLIQVAESTADIGYRVLRRLWGRGFGLAIAKLLIQKATENGIRRLVAEVELENEPSVHILEQLEFEALEIRINDLGNEIGHFELQLIH